MASHNQLTTDPANPNRGTDRGRKAVAESLRELGAGRSIVVDKHGAIIAGNKTFDAAQELGIPHRVIETNGEELIVVRRKDLDLAKGGKARKLSIADNRAGELGLEWDASAIEKAIEGGLDLSGLWDDAELRALLGADETTGPIADDPGPLLDKAAELQTKWGTAAGQLWVIESAFSPGCAHRLLCGDSTRIEDVERLMDGRRALLFATDPPYLVDYDGTNHPSSWEYKKKVERGEKRAKNKDWSDSYGKTWDDASQGEALYEGFVKAAVEVAIDPNAAWYCWHAARNQAMLESVWQRYGAFWHQTIVWVKTCPVLGYSYYMNKSENCVFGWVHGHEPPRVANDFPPNVWEFPNKGDADKLGHPTPKPPELFAIPMRQHLRRGEVCYEPFCGSGSQIVAAEQTGRVCYAIEIAPEYCAVILNRLTGMGLTPRLVDDGA